MSRLLQVPIKSPVADTTGLFRDVGKNFRLLQMTIIHVFNRQPSAERAGS